MRAANSEILLFFSYFSCFGCLAFLLLLQLFLRMGGEFVSKSFGWGNWPAVTDTRLKDGTLKITSECLLKTQNIQCEADETKTRLEFSKLDSDCDERCGLLDALSLSLSPAVVSQVWRGGEEMGQPAGVGKRAEVWFGAANATAPTKENINSQSEQTTTTTTRENIRSATNVTCALSPFSSQSNLVLLAN